MPLSCVQRSLCYSLICCTGKGLSLEARGTGPQGAAAHAGLLNGPTPVLESLCVGQTKVFL